MQDVEEKNDHPWADFYQDNQAAQRGYDLMVSVRISLPVFSSPTDAFGHAVGRMTLEALPEAGSIFPWPRAWAEVEPSYFANSESLIWDVTAWEGPDADFLVTMYGIVCESVPDARACGNFLKQVSGFEIDEY